MRDLDVDFLTGNVNGVAAQAHVGAALASQVKKKSEEERMKEEREAQRRYEQTIGEASKEVPGQMPDGEANP